MSWVLFFQILALMFIAATLAIAVVNSTRSK